MDKHGPAACQVYFSFCMVYFFLIFILFLSSETHWESSGSMKRHSQRRGQQRLKLGPQFVPYTLTSLSLVVIIFLLSASFYCSRLFPFRFFGDPFYHWWDHDQFCLSSRFVFILTSDSLLFFLLLFITHVILPHLLNL